MSIFPSFSCYKNVSTPRKSIGNGLNMINTSILFNICHKTYLRTQISLWKCHKQWITEGLSWLWPTHLRTAQKKIYPPVDNCCLYWTLNQNLPWKTNTPLLNSKITLFFIHSETLLFCLFKYNQVKKIIMDRASMVHDSWYICISAWSFWLIWSQNPNILTIILIHRPWGAQRRQSKPFLLLYY